MGSPFDSARQLKTLNEQKQHLASGQRDVRDLAHRHLAEMLLECEAHKKEMRHLQVTHEIPEPERLRRVLNSVLKRDPSLVWGLSQLLELGQLLDGAPTRLRDTSVPPLTASHQPLSADLIPSALTRFFDWAESPSFAELHPVEQWSIALLRLYEIYPFPKFSEFLISVFCFDFLLKEGFLPPVYQRQELPRFYGALDEAFTLSTQAFVDLTTSACLHAHSRVLAVL